jgi:hypothetical protein
MSLWKLFINAGTVIGVFRTIVSEVQSWIKEKRPPSKADLKILIDAVEKLFDSGVIDFPDLDEKEIVQGLESIKNQL